MGDAIWIDRDIRGGSRWDGRELLIAELAERQHGLVARRQLIELGVNHDAVDRRIQAGRLLPIHRSVYGVGHRRNSKQSAWMAAVLAAGRPAFLSHRCAGAHFCIRPYNGRWIDVTTPRGQHRRPGIRFHRSTLPADEVTIEDGIPVTTVARTIFDLAAELDTLQVERAINEAEVRRLWGDLSLHDLLDRYPRRGGCRTVRAALERREAGVLFLRSDLEEMFVRFAEEMGLPRPETNVLVEGFEVDAVWRAQRLVIEVDSWEVHGTRQAFERDREKSRILQAAGWRCVQVTHLQLRDHVRELARDVRRMLATATLAA